MLLIWKMEVWILYIYIYIYMVPPPKPMQTSILLVFTVNFIYFGTDFVPIKFEAPTVGKLKNWKTEFHRRSLGSILLLWNSVFQFFSSRLLLKGENPKSWKNWKTEKLNSIGEVWGPFFSCGIQFFSFSVLGFSWKVKTRKAEKTEKIKWPQAVSII